MCFILHIFDCDEWEWCELEWVNGVGANRIRPIFHWEMDISIAFALFLFGKYFCVEFDCAEFDLGEFIWCESVIWANVIGRMRFAPTGNIIYRIAILLDCFLYNLIYVCMMRLFVLYVHNNCVAKWNILIVVRPHL